MGLSVYFKTKGHKEVVIVKENERRVLPTNVFKARSYQGEMLSKLNVIKAKCYQGEMLSRQVVIKASCYQGKLL